MNRLHVLTSPVWTGHLLYAHDSTKSYSLDFIFLELEIINLKYLISSLGTRYKMSIPNSSTRVITVIDRVTSPFLGWKYKVQVTKLLNNCLKNIESVQFSECLHSCLPPQCDEKNKALLE